MQIGLRGTPAYVGKKRRMKKLYIVTLLFVSVFVNLPQYSRAQYCDSITPVFNVDLTGNPSGTWFSPAISRDGLCCTALNPYKCIEFIVTLDSTASGIKLNIASGAIPPGALFYQVNCGPSAQVGQYLCLSGPGPHHITFCKPGNNIN